MSLPPVVPLRAVDARYEPGPWAFAEENAEAIRADWAASKAATPALFDGEVLLQHRFAIVDGVYRAGYLAARYSAFLSWRGRGWPGAPMRNGFAMAALRAADGAFLLGRMAAHTANPGRVYFAAGTPDLGDVVDGAVDLAGSALRELEEETGLTAADVVAGEGFDVVIDGALAAFMRAVRIDCGADEARRLMLDRMSALAEPELDEIVIVDRPLAIDPATMPRFMQAYLLHALA